MNPKIAQEKKLYESPDDVFNITEFYWEEGEIQLRARGLRVFKAKGGTKMYDELVEIITAIAPDRVRAYYYVNAMGGHYELVINFPKQVQEPFEHINRAA